MPKPAALPLAARLDTMPEDAGDIVRRASTTWLKNNEVLHLLENHSHYGLPVYRDPPDRPTSGSLFLFNRKANRFFRKDGHEWRTKSDGKTVRETHEKLKIKQTEVLNCYYAHSKANLQRRCYWLLDGNAETVLVHYLDQPGGAARSVAGAAAAAAPHGPPVPARADSLPAVLPSASATITTGEAFPAAAAAAAPDELAAVLLDEALPGSGGGQEGAAGARAQRKVPTVARFQVYSPFASCYFDERDEPISQGRQLDRKRNLSPLQSAPAAAPGFPWSPVQDSRHSSQTFFDPAVEPFGMALPRGSELGLPPLQSRARGSRSSPPAHNEFESVASEAGSTYELALYPALNAMRGCPDAAPGAAPRDAPRSLGPPTGRGRGGDAAVAGASARPKRATATLPSPFQALAQGEPIPRGRPRDEAGGARHHSAGALGLARPSHSQDRVASAAASDFGRLELHTRSSKRQCSGLSSQRLSGPSTGSDSLLEQLLSGALASPTSDPAAGGRSPTPLELQDPEAWQAALAAGPCPLQQAAPACSPRAEARQPRCRPRARCWSPASLRRGPASPARPPRR